MRKNRLILIGVVLAVVLTGIVGCAEGEMSPPSRFPAPTPAPGAAPRVEFLQSDAQDKDEGWPAGDNGLSERMIVRTGTLSLVVEDITESLDALSEVAAALDGYVVSSQRWGKDEDSKGAISIRVPADRYDEALDLLRGLAMEVTSESTESRDVTEEYTDLQSQLDNLAAAEKQYLVIMEKAEEVEDILKVQGELTNVRGQIERIQGRMLYLERTSVTSLITVSLSVVKPATQTGWEANETLDAAIRGIVHFGQFLVDAIIWLGIFCFVWIPPLVIWLRRRRRRKNE